MEGKRHGVGTRFGQGDGDVVWMQGTWVKDELHGENCRVNYQTTKVTQYLGAMRHGVKQGAGNSYHKSGVSGKDFLFNPKKSTRVNSRIIFRTRSTRKSTMTRAKSTTTDPYN